METNSLKISEIPQLSTRDKAYYLSPESFDAFIAHLPELGSFPAVIEEKKKQSIDRQLLHNVIMDQYADRKTSDLTAANINALLSENCFTVTTAHQPSLLTGPLYYIYKILSVIKLAAVLKEHYPDNDFVPLFVIGSEDHDFDEINHLHLYGHKITWEEKGSGSVGSYAVSGLDEILTNASEILGNISKAQPIIDQLRAELPSCQSYDDFAFRLTHLLLDELGIVILRMSDKRLKAPFIPTIKNEILNQVSKPHVVETQTKIKEQLGFNSQAYARDINFFYMHDGNRNRIKKVDGHYKILDSTLSFSAAEIEAEIEAHPERFSPNVVMRPIYQESILPNLAYVGGGGELAYWTERKSQFEYFGIPFPMLIRRRSAIILTPKDEKQIGKLGLEIEDVFQDDQVLINGFLSKSDNPNHQLSDLKEKLSEVYREVTDRIEPIDKTLLKTAGSELAKAEKSIDYLESKLKKVLKQKEQVNLNRIQKLKKGLFPKGLQERHDNIFQFISAYGPEIINLMYEHCDPLEKTFKVFRMPKREG